MDDSSKKSTNIVWHGSYVSRDDRERALGQHGCVLWFTGLSGSGKSTIACSLDRLLSEAGHHGYILDGDNVRHGLNGDLGFTEQDRTENIRRISEVAALFADAGIITITAFISPFQADRDQARRIVEEIDRREGQQAPSFIEVFIDTPLEICEARDPKNLYKKARAGEIPHFTGISSPYEAPGNPEITIHTADLTPDEAAAGILEQLARLGIIAS